MITLPIMIFQTRQEFITFIRDIQIVCTRHHMAHTPADVVSKKLRVAYAHSYNGMYGIGVKVVIFNRTENHHGDNLVIYFIKSNQLDKGGKENG